MIFLGVLAENLQIILVSKDPIASSVGRGVPKPKLTAFHDVSQIVFYHRQDSSDTTKAK